MKKRHSLSIITVCYNEKLHIAETCNSILNQTYKNFEWIVIDGGSTDGTMEVLKKYKNKIDILISEPDKGIYDGMNKGIKLAKGEYILFLNGGDTFYSVKSLSSAFQTKKVFSYDILYGDVNILKKNENIKSNFPNSIDKLFFLNDCINHQSTFIKRYLFQKYGLYETKYPISSDYEKWLCFLKNKIRFYKIPYIISNFRAYGGHTSEDKYKEIIAKEKKQIYSIYYKNIDFLINTIKNTTKKFFYEQKKSSLTTRKYKIKCKMFENMKYIPKPDALLKILFVACIIILSRNLPDNSFWFDETNQFWISQGLNGFSPIYSKTLGILDILKNNNLTNLDPPNFSVILRIWTWLGQSPYILRLLPFMFFILSCYLCYVIAKTWTNNKSILLGTMFVPLSSRLILHFGFELRAYSMELLSTLFAIYLIQYQEITLNSTYKSLFLGICLTILSGARYSAYIYIFFAILIVGAWTLKKRSAKLLKNWFLIAFPVLASWVFTYFSTTQFQNPTLMAPAYVTNFTLQKNGLISTLATANHVQIWLGLAVLIIFSFVKLVFNRLSTFKPFLKFTIYALLVNLTIIFLSLRGMHTWNLDSKWDMSSHIIFLFSYIPCFIFITKNSKLPTHIASLSVLIISICITYFSVYKFKYVSGESTYLNLTHSQIRNDSRLLINAGSLPTIKYLVEKNILVNYKGQSVYDNMTIFNHDRYASKDGINLNLDTLDNYDYISLTQYEYNSSELKKYIDTHPYWKDVSFSKDSKLYSNTHN